MAEQWLTTLITDTPQEGFELAITLSRRGVRYTQPDPEVLQRLRPEYAEDASELTAASQVIALNFQTIAAAQQLLALIKFDGTLADVPCAHASTGRNHWAGPS